MGTTKTEHFSHDQNELSKTLKALAHPARIAIVQHLLSVNSCICNDLVAEIPLAQPTISQHLKELKNAGIIRGTVEGNAVCYCLNPAALEKITAFFQEVLREVQIKHNCC